MPQADGRFAVTTSQGAELIARAVFIAAGVGAFVPKALKVEGIEAFAGTQLYYQHLPPAARLQGQRVVVQVGQGPKGPEARGIELAD